MKTIWVLIHTLSFFQFPDVPVQSYVWDIKTFLSKKECEVYLVNELFYKEIKKDKSWIIQSDKIYKVLIKRSNANQNVIRCMKIEIELAKLGLKKDN